MAGAAAVTAFVNPLRADAVAALGEVTSEVAVKRLRERLEQDEVGRRLLVEKPSISEASLGGMDRLRDLPEGTFGHAYAHYMDEHDFHTDERPPVRFIRDEHDAWVLQRYRQVHDFWHVLSGLPPTVAGELGLKWFEMVQTGLPMTALSAFFGPLRLSSEEQRVLFRYYVPWATRAAQQTPFLLAVEYEKLMEEDLTVSDSLAPVQLAATAIASAHALTPGEVVQLTEASIQRRFISAPAAAMERPVSGIEGESLAHPTVTAVLKSSLPQIDRIAVRRPPKLTPSLLCGDGGSASAVTDSASFPAGMPDTGAADRQPEVGDATETTGIIGAGAISGTSGVQGAAVGCRIEPTDASSAFVTAGQAGVDHVGRIGVAVGEVDGLVSYHTYSTLPRDEGAAEVHWDEDKLRRSLPGPYWGGPWDSSCWGGTWTRQAGLAGCSHSVWPVRPAQGEPYQDTADVLMTHVISGQAATPVLPPSPRRQASDAALLASTAKRFRPESSATRKQLSAPALLDASGGPLQSPSSPAKKSSKRAFHAVVASKLDGKCAACEAWARDSPEGTLPAAGCFPSFPKQLSGAQRLKRKRVRPKDHSCGIGMGLWPRALSTADSTWHPAPSRPMDTASGVAASKMGVRDASEILNAPTIVLRGILGACGIENSQFQAPSLGERYGQQLVLTVTQSHADASVGFSLPKHQWATEPIPFCRYIEHQVALGGSPRRLDDAADKWQVGGPSVDSVLFCPNVEMDKWVAERTKLRDCLPEWMVCGGTYDILQLLPERVDGVTSPQAYFKVAGVWTGGHEENNRVRSVNCNHGPAPSIWATVPASSVPRLRDLARAHFDIDIYQSEGLWMPPLEWCARHGVEVRCGVQEAGDVVLVNGGSVHWVVGTGPAVHTSWNFALPEASQLLACAARAKINRTLMPPMRSLVSIGSLCVRLAPMLLQSEGATLPKPCFMDLDTSDFSLQVSAYLSDCAKRIEDSCLSAKKSSIPMVAEPGGCSIQCCEVSQCRNDVEGMWGVCLTCWPAMRPVLAIETTGSILPDAAKEVAPWTKPSTVRGPLYMCSSCTIDHKFSKRTHRARRFHSKDARLVDVALVKRWDYVEMRHTSDQLRMVSEDRRVRANTGGSPIVSVKD